METEKKPAVPPSEQAETALAVRQEQIPAELLLYPQWVCWRYGDQGPGKKRTKQPVNPWHVHRHAGVHWPRTWSTFAHAYMTYLMYRGQGIEGVGFVLTPEDPFVGVDLDGCVGEGNVSPQAQAVVDHVQSYTELSPSGTGLRILATCPEFETNSRRPGIEVYAHSRFLTLTGHHLAGTPTTIARVEADRVAALLPPKPEGAGIPLHWSPNSASKPVEEDALWERIFHSDRYGAQHRQRFAGDTTLDGGDHSLTVIRLLNSLARWTGGDAAHMRRMMLMSPLANDKWFSRRGMQDWLDYQIADAIRYLSGSGRRR